MGRHCLVIVTTLLAATYAAVGQAGPGGVRRARAWQLDFQFEDPQRIDVELPGEDDVVTFWYLLYTVTNNTGREVEFYPSFALVTDALQAVEGGANLNPRVFDAIRARHAKQYPLLVEPLHVSGRLLQGHENRRDSVAIFRQFDAEENRFTVFVEGLSSKITRMANPTFDRDEPEGESNRRAFSLRRTLAIEYELPGDRWSRARASPTRLSMTWVMR